MNGNHLSPEKIQSYINFTLDEAENERILTHLSICDDCLARVDAQWEQQAPGLLIEERTAEKKLMRSIHRSDLAGNLLVLAAKGFLRSVIGLVKPFIRKK